MVVHLLPNVITTPPTNLAVTGAPTSSKCSNGVTATGGLSSLDFDIIEFNNVPTILYPTQSTPGSGTATSFVTLLRDYTFR
jgi:hypothetical protein